MAIISEKVIGKTRVLIDDDYCVRMQEDIDTIVDSISEIWTESLIKENVSREI